MLREGRREKGGKPVINPRALSQKARIMCSFRVCIKYQCVILTFAEPVVIIRDRVYPKRGVPPLEGARGP